MALMHESLEEWHRAGTPRIGLVEFADELEALIWLKEEGGEAIKAAVVNMFQSVLKAPKIVDSPLREKILVDLVDGAASMVAEDKKSELGDVASVPIQMLPEGDGEF